MPQLAWHKSSFSTGDQGECVEVAADPNGLIHLRESDQPDEILTATPTPWAGLLHHIKAGTFDQPPLS